MGEKKAQEIKMPDKKESIVGKFIFEGTILSTSALRIGNGEGELSDIEIIRGYGDKPYIPSSSFTNGLKNYFYKTADISDLYAMQLVYFWGHQKSESDENKESQSHLVIEDLRLIGDSYNLSVRDGIRIEGKTGLTKNAAKYDYEVLEPGVKFHLQGEVSVREEFKTDVFRAVFQFINQMLSKSDNDFRIGSNKTAGFGRIKLEDFKVYEFEFSEKKNMAVEYLLHKSNVARCEEALIDLNAIIPQIKKKEQNKLLISGEFELATSLIIGAAPTDDADTDKAHLKSNGLNILSGRSLKGAFKARALKILNTLQINADISSDFYKEWMHTEDKNEYASRLRFDEVIIEKAVAQIQPRVKIDRFTGGAMDHKLFSSEPIWHKDENFTIRISLEEPKPGEIGLMLLVLKDLCNGDLPIGGEKNVGRGRLKNNKLCIDHNGKVFRIENGKLVVGKVEELNTFVNALFTLK
jgi:CRISPR/Cas system CSM-associated protein Csm3 (group 7 of RAMP superfamily)